MLSAPRKSGTKGKMVMDLLEDFSLGNPSRVMFDHKDLDKRIGFLLHLATTYDWMKPFLRGFT